MPTLSDFWRTFKTTSPILQVPFETMTGVGLLPAIIDPRNAVGFRPMFSDQNGKRKIAKYKYQQRKLASTVKTEAVDGIPNYCTATDVPSYKEAEQEVTKRTYSQFFIPEADVRSYEENFATVLMDEIKAHASAFLEDMNADLIAIYEATRGTFFGGSATPVSAQGFSSVATYTVNHAFEQKVYDEFRKLQYRGQKMMVGDTLVNAYFRTLSKGAANSDRGQVNNLDVMRDFVFFDDTMLDAEIATPNTAFVWRPGSIQLLEWFQNQGEFAKNQDRVIKDTMDWQLGDVNLKIDITITENFCTDETSGLIVTLQKHWDSWTFPADIFAGADVLNGTNGMLRFTMTAA